MPEGIAKISKTYRSENGIPTLGTPERIAGADASSYTAPTGPGPVPTVTTAPAITGSTVSGQTLTLSTGSFTGSPTYLRQWYADGVAIAGATATTLVLGAAQVGKRITARTIATNANGQVTTIAGPTATVTAA